MEASPISRVSALPISWLAGFANQMDRKTEFWMGQHQVWAVFSFEKNAQHVLLVSNDCPDSVHQQKSDIIPKWMNPMENLVYENPCLFNRAISNHRCPVFFPPKGEGRKGTLLFGKGESWGSWCETNMENCRWVPKLNHPISHTNRLALIPSHTIMKKGKLGFSSM